MMTEIRFYKMEGAGNDFVVIDNREIQFSLERIIESTPKLCDRKFGVGADGLLVLENPQLEDVDYTMIYRNADGSDAGMCGNGSRCLALFAAAHGFDSSHYFNVHKSIYSADVNTKENAVAVSFPDVEVPKNIVVDKAELIQVYTGTEHVVQFVDEEYLKEEQAMVSLGSKIRYSDLLKPSGTNVNFVCNDGKRSLNLQTYEKGVEGLTLACGTGAIAAAIATHFSANEQSEEFKYVIYVKGGTLKVSFTFNQNKNMYQNIKLIGPASYVFEGKINV